MPSVSGIQMSSSTRSGRSRVAGLARRGGVLGQAHRVPFVGKDLREQFADPDFVVDDQYRCHLRSLRYAASGSAIVTAAPPRPASPARFSMLTEP